MCFKMSAHGSFGHVLLQRLKISAVTTIRDSVSMYAYDIPHFDGIYGLCFGFSSYKTCFLGGRASTKVETYPPKKNLTTSLQNPLPNPLVLVHQCHTSSLENHLVNLCFQKDTFVKTYAVKYIYMIIYA